MMLVSRIFGIILVAVAILASASADAAKKERRVALVIGNGKYLHTEPLPNPSNDARALAASLRRVGFHVEEVIDAEKADMDYVLRRFNRLLKTADVSLFFYAGHGMQIDGENYLVPVNAQFTRNFKISEQLMEMSHFMEGMEKGPKVNMVFLDACRNNPLADFLGKGLRGGRSVIVKGKRKARSIGQGLAKMKGMVGTLIAYATQPGNVAEDGEGKNSPFTKSLLKHIEEPGLEVRQFLTRVRVGVLKDTGDRQVPWDNSSLTTDFYFKAAEKPAEVFLAPP